MYYIRFRYYYNTKLAYLYNLIKKKYLYYNIPYRTIRKTKRTALHKTPFTVYVYRINYGYRINGSKLAVLRCYNIKSNNNSNNTVVLIVLSALYTCTRTVCRTIWCPGANLLKIISSRTFSFFSFLTFFAPSNGIKSQRSIHTKTIGGT